MFKIFKRNRNKINNDYNSSDFYYLGKIKYAFLCIPKKTVSET